MGIEMTQTGGAKHMQRQIVAASRQAAADTVDHWHRRMMPGHFEPSAMSRYGYQPRRGDREPPRIVKRTLGPDGQVLTRDVANPAYSWRKRRQKGHNRPLVWSGNSEKAAKLGVQITTRVSRRDAEVVGAAVMPFLPDYFYQYRKDLSTPDKADELTRTAPSEVTALMDVYASSYERHMAAAGDGPTSRTTF